MPKTTSHRNDQQANSTQESVPLELETAARPVPADGSPAQPTVAAPDSADATFDLWTGFSDRQLQAVAEGLRGRLLAGYPGLDDVDEGSLESTEAAKDSTDPDDAHPYGGGGRPHRHDDPEDSADTIGGNRLGGNSSAARRDDMITLSPTGLEPSHALWALSLLVTGILGPEHHYPAAKEYLVGVPSIDGWSALFD